MLDARERAPLTPRCNIYFKADHDLAMNSATSAGILGMPAALDHL
jgi:gamma-glutamyltranspeptidase